MRRFFRKAEAEALPSGGFHVLLDGRPLKNRASGTDFRLSSKALADAVAGEWQAVGEEFDFSVLPLTALTMGASALTPEQRDAAVARIIEGARTDVLCFWAPYPDALVLLQKEKWEPLIDWANGLGCAFRATQELSVPPLADATRRYLEKRLKGLASIPLACVQLISGGCQSALLALAVLENRINAGEAFDLSCLEEAFQNQFWTSDEEAVKAREARRKDVLLAASVLKMHNGG